MATTDAKDFSYLVFGNARFLEADKITGVDGKPMFWPSRIPQNILDAKIVDGQQTLPDGFRVYTYDIGYGSRQGLANGNPQQSLSRIVGTALTVFTKDSDFHWKLLKLMTTQKEAIPFVGVVGTANEGSPRYAVVLKNARLAYMQIMQNPLDPETAILQGQTVTESPKEAPLVRLEFTGEILNTRSWFGNAVYTADYNFATSGVSK